MKIPLDSDIPDIARYRLRKEWGDYLHGLADWTWWATFTFNHYFHESEGLKVFKRWLAEIARVELHAHYTVAWVVESAGGSSHVHALLAVPEAADLTAKQLGATWKRLDVLTGYVDIKRYDPTKGAAWYITKQFAPDVRIVCPRLRSCRRRGRGCIYHQPSK